MKQLIDILHNEGLTLVIKSSDGYLHRFTQRGVKDLVSLVSERPEVLQGAIIADKAVGKAAAACMVVGGVRQVHADVMSEPALAMLQNHGVDAQYSQLVDHIINRTGTDWCPMERLSRDEDDPEVIIQKVKEKLASLAEH
jgi:iron complex outermembrane receptor protein